MAVFPARGLLQCSCLLWALVMFGLQQPVAGWQSDELEIFDLVEEMNQTFYEYMGIETTASTSEIKRAYRRLSLVLHPDRNSAEDAGLKFRWLAAVYEVLKDDSRRAIYDRVLSEGLPNWRQPLFYYRRMRKMGLAECLLHLFVIATVIQYCVNWAVYWEKGFTLKERIGQHQKKWSKRLKKSAKEEVDDLELSLLEEQDRLLGPKPTCYDTLPFQVVRLLKTLLLALPTLPATLRSKYRQHKEKEAQDRRLREEQEEEHERRLAEKKQKKERQKLKKKETKLYREKQAHSDDNSSDSEGAAPLSLDDDVYSRPANALQIWTDDDLAKLAKLIKKYPAGTVDRWDTIADILQRLPHEVTKMAKNIKDHSYMVPFSRSVQGVTGLQSVRLVSDDLLESNASKHQLDSERDSDDETSGDEEHMGMYSMASKADYVPVEVKVKKKTRGGKTGDSEGQEQEGTAAQDQDTWTQVQQKALESALQLFPKGTTDRWDRIAGKVSGKTKEQCMLRVRHLAEVVKKRKEASS